jgi:hypothetical protein
MLPFHYYWAEAKVSLIISAILNPYLGYSVVAMAPLVCTFSGPLARRIAAALLASQFVAFLMAFLFAGLLVLPDLLAFALSAAGLLWPDAWPEKKASIFPRRD